MCLCVCVCVCVCILGVRSKLDVQDQEGGRVLDVDGQGGGRS